ncbi:MAG: HAD hydrolase-like protein, partial [Anaerolineaceae bacterium]|nr:HAD hydrolase-like protein [Anaerolineaceae bacterium]
QRAKFEALGLADRFGHVIYTDRWGLEFRKPHPRAFEEFERLTGCPPHECAYVADNPTKDFRAPHERLWQTVRVTRPEGLYRDMPSVPGEVEATITALDTLAEALEADRS